MKGEHFTDIIATLITNGFNIAQVIRITPENYAINVFKFDKLGAKVSYSLFFSDDDSITPPIKQLSTIAKSFESKPILISDKIDTSSYETFTTENFFALFGGIINTGLILIPNLENILDELGHNKVPSGLVGNADDLHELYAKECLQFVTNSPTRRYGIDRLFTSLPDGVVLGKDKMLLLYDSKAYKDGFNFTADDIKRFASYVNDFNSRYSSYLGTVFSFIVISGHFNDSKISITNKSDDLYRLCNCKISCITSSELGKIVKLLKKSPEYRESINWRNIFSELIIETKQIEKEIKRIIKDKIY
jgi:hypothetical protein